jgi:hypothetical protein
MQFGTKLNCKTVQLRNFANIKPAKPIKKSLTDALRVEITKEEEDYEEDQEYLDYKEKVCRSFSLNERPNKKVVILTRTFNKVETITVKFDLDDTSDDDGEERLTGRDEIDDGDDEIPDGMEVGGFGVEFEVTITKEGRGSLVLFCTSCLQLTVNNVTYYPEGIAIGDTKTYVGRDLFVTPGIQKALKRYMRKRKIDEDFRLFMMSHFNIKETGELLGWMKNVLNFNLKGDNDLKTVTGTTGSEAVAPESVV